MTIVLLIFNYIWEVKHREIIKYLNRDNSNKVCFVFEAERGKCKTCLGCLKMFPPQLLILKQWIFLLFALAAAQFITTQPDTKHYKNVAGFANSFVAMIGITLGIILNTSLQKHEDAIRLFEMYTGDIIALAMELTAFIENAGEGTKVNQALKWDEDDMSENNSKLAEHREKLARQIVTILKNINIKKFTSWKGVMENKNTLKNEYPIFYTESRRFPLVDWPTWITAYKQIKQWFPSSQTRKTLTSAWRRLYGTYGDMSTVKTYDLPRVITMTMELSLIGSCFMLPLSSLHGFVDTCSENCQAWAETMVTRFSSKF